ncbi:serine/threonine protein kinase [Hyalangium rubrum]|uniref:non-specific serine/threonine protein kinase n=1 Tax=Hyalangium rubrum TaxID=3103134 RepID=A0ABU5HEW2_9BACT|nr:protein kinase [Hyalangium sp. s54d21]MDY7230620.1 protein kinase [Hyalangium sp. s54d21]
MTARLVRLPSGASLDGWHVLGELGNGGFAIVYLAEKNGQRRALKVARHRDASGDDKQTHGRVMRELTALLLLDHPNIIRHRGYGYAESGNVYLALDYVDGWTLGEWKERKHPTFHEVLRVFVKLADALVYIHSRGILHRDLKLANVLIRKTDGEPVIIDFSCATYTQAADLTESGLPPGTDRFRAPEQFRFLREHRDEHRGRYAFQVADEIFAVGAMLYELLTDPRPTEARPRESLNNPAAMPPPTRGLNPRVPEALSDLVESILSRDPKRRPVDTEALRRELAELLADPGADYQAHAHAPSEQRQPESLAGAEPAELHAPSRRRGLAVGAVAAVVLAAVVALWMLPGAPPLPGATPGPPPVTASPAMSPAPAPVEFTGSVIAPEQKEGATLTTQPTEAPKQALGPRERGQKTTPSADVCKGLTLAAAIAAGCTGAQIRPEPFTCPEGARRAMRELRWNDSDRFSLQIDDRHGTDDNIWLRPGDTVVGVVPQDVRGQQVAPPGTQFLGGKVYVWPDKTNSGMAGRVVVKFERAKLPRQEEVPVCVVVDTHADELKDGAGRTWNRDVGLAVDFWP